MGMAPVHGRSRRAGHRGGQPRGGYSAAGDHHPQRPKKPLSVRPKPTTTSLVGTASPSIWPGVPPVRPRSSCDERRTVLQTYTFEVTGSPADLIVESVSVSDSSLTPRQSFTLSATVRLRAGVSLLRPPCAWYRSSNATISTRDMEVGTDPVGALAVDASSAESIRLTACRRKARTTTGLRGRQRRERRQQLLPRCDRHRRGGWRRGW